MPQSRECPKMRAAKAEHWLRSQLRSACGETLETGYMINAISLQGSDASCTVADKCFFPLQTLTHVFYSRDDTFLSKAEAGTASFIPNLQSYAAVFEQHLSTCSECGILTFNSLLHPSEFRPLFFPGSILALSYSWVLMFSTSLGLVLAEQQFPMGDGASFSFCPAQWGVRSGAATAPWLRAYRIKCQIEHAL